jgi:hypothetical protein
MIYKQLIRERVESIEGLYGAKLQDAYVEDKLNVQALDFEYFKKALIRISVMAQDKLGG